MRYQYYIIVGRLPRCTPLDYRGIRITIRVSEKQTRNKSRLKGDGGGDDAVVRGRCI